MPIRHLKLLNDDHFIVDKQNICGKIIDITKC